MDILSIIAKIDNLKQEISNSLLDMLEQFTKPFFDENPDIKGIGWIQYIPSYNDGEPCTLSFYDVVILNKNVNLEDDYLVTSIIQYNYENKTDEELYEVNQILYDNPVIVRLNDMLCNKNLENIFMDVFGENQIVILTKDGIIMYGYEPGY